MVKQKPLNDNDELSGCNGYVNTVESNILEDSGLNCQDTRSRLSRIAGLKRLEFTSSLPSADSTPSMEESKLSGEFDDSSSFLSPTEDCSDTWSVSSDYADAREFITPPTNEDSVSERIRRKSFYTRFNQSKRKKSSQPNQLGGSRSRLPMYSKSMSSDFSTASLSKPMRKISDPDAPVHN
uniref:Uncharacterized protein n=1 Tax=Graphocephala atropunctata TaxID=36148 RepID=A0A1B6L146_9HEMI